MKKITSDIALNIVSMGVITVALQLIAYPLISRIYNNDEFGLVLTIMGIVNIISVVVGVTINNVQLVSQDIYDSSKKFYGDFKFLFYTYLIISAGVTFLLFSLPLFSMNILHTILLSILVVLTTCRSYLTVYWRLNLNYKFIAIHSVVTAIGYILGATLFTHTFAEFWEIVFLTGELSSLIFLLIFTNFRKILRTRSENITKINKDILVLASSNIVANTLTYFDRFILQGLMGAREVSVYFAASLFGKMASIILQPISNVILSYLSKEGTENKKKYFNLFLLMSIFSGLFLFIVSIVLSPIVIKILYPSIYIEAVGIINMANASAILLIVGSLFQPLLLKYSNLGWQNFIQLVYTAVFVLLGYYLTKEYGLNGFVMASVISNAVRYVLFVCVGYFSIVKNISKNSDI